MLPFGFGRRKVGAKAYSMEKKTIKQSQQESLAKLLSAYPHLVTGATPSKDEKDEPVIEVYLAKKPTAAEEKAITADHDGYRVVTQITGTIRAKGRKKK